MLGIALDIFGAYCIAKYIRERRIAILLSLLFGIVSAMVVSMFIHFTLGDLNSAGETFARFIVGAVWHPIVTIISFFYFKRRMRKESKE